MKKTCLLLVAWTAMAAASISAEVMDRIVASVDGEPITLYELRQFVSQQRAQMPNLPAVTDKEALQALITEKLVAKEIVARGIQIRDEDIDHYIDRIKQQNHIDDDQLREALKQQGLDYTKYRQQIREEIEKVQLLNKVIRAKVTISPEDVHRYYEAHKKDYARAGSVKVRQITLRLDDDAPEPIVTAVMERIEDVRKRLLKGEDFATVAKQVSEDPLAAEGGDLGEIEPSKLLPEFEGPLLKMKEGEISEPIRTKVGVHLLKLEKRITEAFQPESEVAAEIKEKLYNEALDERYRRWIVEDIQQHHYIETKL
jgi:peptidyl-prolyl cis-trans isomerase SurA